MIGKKLLAMFHKNFLFNNSKNNIAFSLEKNEVDEIHLKECLEKASN